MVGGGGALHGATDRLSWVHEIIPLEAGDVLHTFEKSREHDEHDATERNADDEEACPVQLADGFDEGLAAGLFAAEEIHGEEEISDGRKDHASSHADGRLEEKLGEIGALRRCDDGLIEQGSIDQLRREQDGFDEGLSPSMTEWESEAEEDGYGGLFHREPKGIELQKAEAASEDDGDKTEDGKKVQATACEVRVNAEAERDHEGDDERPKGAESIRLAEPLESGRRQDDGEKEIVDRIGRCVLGAHAWWLGSWSERLMECGQRHPSTTPLLH